MADVDRVKETESRKRGRMRLVIDIPDDIYEQTINGTEYDTLSLGIKLRQSVQEGVVIPKGHGRLIDADRFLAMYDCFGYIEDMGVEYFNKVTPTIIEADKEN